MNQASTPQTVVDYHPAPKPTGGSWINPRIAVFGLVVLCIFGFLFYLWLQVAATHGVTARGDAFEVDLKSMSTFPFDQKHGTTEDVPPRYRELDGKKVILIGEMWAPNASGPRLDNFDLVYSIAKCCFSGPPQIQHFIKSTKPGDPVPFYDGLVRVTGTLSVKVTKDPDGKITGIYHVNVESVDPV